MKNSLLFLAAILSAPALAEETRFDVPSDAKARYAVLDKAGDEEMRVITTRRAGPSGTSYASRLYNCSDGTFKYLGEGDTLEEMEASKPDLKMTPLVHGSISYYVGIEACK